MRLFLLITKALAQTACPRSILLSAIAAAAAHAARAASEGRRTSAREGEAYDFPVKPLFDDEPCPSVYVYDHAAFWPTNASLDAVAALSADDVFGPRCSEAIPEERPTGQFEMAHIVVWRLTRPPRPSLHACRPVWKSTTGLGGPHQTSELSISIKSKSIRLIFGRIDCSRRVLEARPKRLRHYCRVCSH